jgi:hypothetical protein
MKGLRPFLLSQLFKEKSWLLHSHAPPLLALTSLALQPLLTWPLANLAMLLWVHKCSALTVNCTFTAKLTRPSQHQPLFAQ